MNRLALDLVEFAIRASAVSLVICAATAVGLWWLREHGARTRVLVVRAALVALGLSLAGSLPLWSDPLPVTTDIEVTRLADGSAQVRETGAGWTLSPGPVRLTAAALAAGWVLGLGLLLAGVIRIARLTHASAWVAPGCRESDAVRSPVTVGLRQAVVILPTGTLARPDAKWVLAHERAHAANRDPAWLMLAASLRVALFFQPTIYWLAYRLDLEQELAADELVVNAGADRRAYAHTLLDWAEARLARPRWIPVAHLSRTQLEGRVRRVLAVRAKHDSRVQVVAALLLVAIALASLGCSIPTIALAGSNRQFDREIEVIESTQP